MKIPDKTSIIGTVTITVCDGNTGEIKHVQEQKNLITQLGLNFIASKIVNTSGAMSHMALGNGATPPTISDTTLASELGRVTLQSQSSTNNVALFSAFFGQGVATGTLAEAGIFNSASGGTMFNRALISPTITKNPTDTVTVQWNITVS